MTNLFELLGLQVLKLLGKKKSQRDQSNKYNNERIHLFSLIIANCTVGIAYENYFKNIWYLMFSLFSDRQYEI